MDKRPFLIHTLSPLHAGTGQSVDVIDLPIARMKGTNIPLVPGSSIKGVLRDARQPADGADKNPWYAVFGPETKDASDNAGALIVSDARLLCLPVRSFKGTFAYVTSPLLLTLAARDLDKAPAIPAISGHGARTADGSACLHEGKVFLEDLDLSASPDPKVKEWADVVAKLISPETPDFVTKRFIVVDDETMTFLWETATQIDTRVRINAQTRVVDKGALWIEESLPSESILIGLLAADRSRRKGMEMPPSAVLDHGLNDVAVLQFGGKATVGRGRCRMIPVGR